MGIKLIVGLRNPGAAYSNTRHNAGGWFVENLVRQNHASFKIDKKLQGELANLAINERACKALLPLTYMNHSGHALRAVAQFYRINPDEILVAHDDLDLMVGRIKLKSGGGHGGHNGLRDIVQQLASTDFHRLRIGIGHPGHKELVLNYVLGKPQMEERDLIFEAINRAITVMPAIVLGNWPDAMNAING